MKYDVVIGLEVHAQLLTNTKIFCSCPNKFGNIPNNNTCPVCTGQPGSLPVLNKKVVEFAIKTGLATNCKINSRSIFARKNYFYPDLPKGYQISQYELPICEFGKVKISLNGKEKRIGITRIHMEEDAGKLSHDGIDKNSSYVDFNRTGSPLIEIVSEPDITSPEEAAEYLKQLRNILVYLEVCDGNMEEGSFRCDANISLKPQGSSKLGTKAELKNMNSFRNVQRALEYEIKRQTEILDEGGQIIQETRLWNAEKGITESMRSKEEAHDYRYFPDPDLIPLVIDNSWINKISETLPELPYEKEKRFISHYKLSKDDAEVLVSDKKLSDFFETTVKITNDAVMANNWIRVELLGSLNYDGKHFKDCMIAPEQMGALINMIKKGTISGKIAKTVFREMYETLKNPEDIVKEKGLIQISDEDELNKIVKNIIDNSQAQVEQYKNGKTKVFGYFVGQVMKQTKGQANPQIVNKILKKYLDV